MRHWLLLFLRCAVLALLAAALARPSIQASGMLGDQEAPVAAALVFDTSPRLGYRLFGRIAAKDAVRTLWWEHRGERLFPADIEIDSGPDGRLTARRRGWSEDHELPTVTVAHADGLVAAEVSDGCRRGALVFVEGSRFCGSASAEIGGDDAVMFEDDGAFGAGDFDAARIAGVGGRGGVENSERAAGKFEDSGGGIFGFDFVKQRAGASLHANNITEQPEEQCSYA